MSLLKFGHDDSATPRSKKPLKLILGVGVLAGVIALGSTLAASINLNSGGPIEFGQGVAQTVACDSDGVELTPFAQFYNSEADAAFFFSSLKVSGVSSNCADVVFKLRAYMNGNSTPRFWPSDPDEDSFEFGFRANAGWYSVSSCMDLNDSVTDDSLNNSVTIDWSGCVPYAAEFAGSIDRLTLETSRNPDAGVFPVIYSLGDTGPAGGKVFYNDPEGFACGPNRSSTCYYLEAATSDIYGDACNSDSVAGNSDSAILPTENINTIGAGYASTLVITDVCNSGAAFASRALVGSDGQTDWYLPNRYELIVLYNNRASVGGFVSANYWSSWANGTQFGAMNFEDGYANNSYPKAEYLMARAIRAF